jgi:hypothetical protein
MGMSEYVFSRFCGGIASGFHPNLRYLSVSGNEISSWTAGDLKRFIIQSKKLIYLDIEECEMDMPTLNTILDGCEINGKMQVLCAGKTIATTEEGMKSIEMRMSSGSLCLLHIVFHPQDEVEAFMGRIRKHMRRHYEERMYIKKIQEKKLDPGEVVDALSCLAHGPDGIENVYRCLTINKNNEIGVIALIKLNVNKKKTRR